MVYSVEEISSILAPFVATYQIPRVYLFGSYARGEADEDSDIDLAIVEEGSQVGGFHYVTFLEELKNLFEKEVDCLGVEDIYRGKSPIDQEFRTSFEKDKVLIYEKDTVGERFTAS